MDPTSAIHNARQSLASTETSASLGGLDTDAFLKLMIAQLQNQDPLNPTDNNELLQQVNEIRNIGATDKLTQTLNSVLLGQNLTSATSLIGRKIEAADDEGNRTTGVVDKVSLVDGVPKLHIGEHLVGLTNIISVVPAE